MSDPVFVSYFTLDTPYEEEIKGLIKCFGEFGLDFDIWARPSTGNWIANCSMISTVCREAVEKYPYRPVVFLPADVKIMKMPELLFNIPEDVDFATRYATWHKRLGSQLNTSILYFAPTEAAKRLVAEWEKNCAADRKVFDQVVLQEIIDRNEWGGRWLNLPETYCRIFDNPSGDTGEPVIVAYQASRRHKAKVNA